MPPPAFVPDEQLPMIPVAALPGTDVLTPYRLSSGQRDESPTREGIRELSKAWTEHLAHMRLVYEPAVALDLLCSVLASQLVLFAGPSGTGKSSAARAASTFFASVDSRRVIEGRRQMLGPEDVAGYASPIDHSFVAGMGLPALMELSAPGVDPPVLVVEEANLSYMEGYLGPLIHGLSGLSSPGVDWALHQDHSITKVPKSLTLRPWPRVLGTINVDPTAPPPSPKVGARACVVVLDTRQTSAAAAIQVAYDAITTPGIDPLPHEARGAGSLGDPTAVFRSTDYSSHHEAVVAALTGEIQALLPSTGPNDESTDGLSARQFGQMLTFTAWYSLIADEDPNGKIDPAVLIAGARNAIVHFALPSLTGKRLSSTLAELAALTGDATADAIAQRAQLLQGTHGGFLGAGTLDFWDRLS